MHESFVWRAGQSTLIVSMRASAESTVFAES